MRLQIIRDEAAFLALKPYWDALLERSAVCSPFLRWDWMWLWWEEFRTDFTLAVAVIVDAEQKPLAIAPLMLGQETSGMRKHLIHLGFLAGLGEVKGERMDFLVPMGRETELTPLLCRAFALLQPEWETVRLNKLPEESPNHPFIIEALNECSIGVNVVIRTECMCIRLAASWQDVESRLATKRKRELRRRWELLVSEQHADEQQTTAEEAEKRLDELAALHTQHYPEGVSSFITPRSWRFHRRLGLKWIPEGRALLPFIGIDSAMAGGLYGFVERGEFFFFQIGWDASLARYSLGHLTLRWAVQSCVARQMKLFDMLPGNYRYKSEWTGDSRFVIDLEAYQPESLRAALFRGFRYMKRQFRAPSECSAKSE